jgi:RNA recognition motif-containing protein
MPNRLYVANLPEDVTASTLQELFEPYGFVMDVKVVASAGLGEPRTFALVTMATDESASVALRALNGASLHGALICVQEAPAEPPGTRSASGGGA